VQRFCETARVACRLAPSRGWSGKSYRPQRTAITGDHFYWADWPGKGKVLVHDAWYWRIKAQKAFFLPPGVPQSASMFGADKRVHWDFAVQIASEMLVPKKIEYADDQTTLEWVRKPGTHEHWLDCVVGCFVGAAALGASVSGEPCATVQSGAPAAPQKARATYTEV
jgi:hypothetical protein